tara:strand:- start:161 stop:604 length:444 start_codon:yes stop_codon:yes gene_type:complete
MKEGYRSLKEILKEVGEEEGLSMKEINDIWLHQKTYIKKSMEMEGVYSILLPFIGTLSLNVKQYAKEIKGKKREFYDNFTKKVEELKKHPNYSQYENAHKRVTGVNRLARYIISKYDTGLKKNKKLIVKSKCWKIIEKYSNGVFEKK